MDVSWKERLKDNYRLGVSIHMLLGTDQEGLLSDSMKERAPLEKLFPARKTPVLAVLCGGYSMQSGVGTQDSQSMEQGENPTLTSWFKKQTNKRSLVLLGKKNRKIEVR